MKNLKELRESRGLTQKGLAELVGTTQQTVGRWENGKAEPSISTLSDLALIFETSVDSLLGKKTEHTTNTHFMFTSDGEDGFWGHIGIKLVKQNSPTWYPISYHEYQRVQSVLCDEPEWVYVETLNNRALFFDVNKVQKITLLDDAADETEDFEAPRDGYAGLPSQMYQGLAELVQGGCETDSYSEQFRQTITDFVTEQQLDNDGLSHFLLKTHLYDEAGSTLSTYIAGESLFTLQMEVDGSGKAPKMIALQEDDNLTFYPAARLAMINAPLITLLRPAQERAFADE